MRWVSLIYKSRDSNCINGEDIETWFNIPQEEEARKMVISISDKNSLIQLCIAFQQKILNLEYGQGVQCNYL